MFFQAQINVKKNFISYSQIGYWYNFPSVDASLETDYVVFRASQPLNFSGFSDSAVTSHQRVTRVEKSVTHRFIKHNQQERITVLLSVFLVSGKTKQSKYLNLTSNFILTCTYRKSKYYDHAHGVPQDTAMGPLLLMFLYKWHAV